MTPKEKAEEIISNFEYENNYGISENTGLKGINQQLAKQCALLAVNFHLKEFEDLANITCCGESFSWKYWEEVKQEIENL